MKGVNMKNRRLIALIVGLTMVMTMFLAACSSAPKTLEEYISGDQEAMDEINEPAASAGLDVSISENNVVYTYDLKNFDGMTEDLAKSDTMVSSLGAALDSAGDTFISLCSRLEEETKIEGINIIVNYTYDGEVLVTKTFTAPAADTSEEGTEDAEE